MQSVNLKNKLIIAAAGSGKTTHLVNESLSIKNENVLITTFTIQNENGIKSKIIEKLGFIPRNIIVQTWFSFILQHGVRPFQNAIFEGKIRGMEFVSQRSDIYSKESDIQRHYFNKAQQIYSDKISKFAIKCNVCTDGSVINRISKIFSYIMIDEAQDIGGYDLDFLKILLQSPLNILLVGDPRQSTYITTNSQQNKKYKQERFVLFFQEKISDLEIDDRSLNTNHRSNSLICKLSNQIFPEYSSVNSGNNLETGHDGIFLVKPKDVTRYLETYNPIQLRDSSKKAINEKYEVMNFGESKGLTFDRILIYPTTPYLNWLKNRSFKLAPKSKSKFYVALTRARFSVGIVYNYLDTEDIQDVLKFKAKE